MFSQGSCPKCGGTTNVKRWYEDHYLVEERIECSCGYVYHWSYGSVLEDDEDE